MKQNKFFEKFLENLSKIDEFNLKTIIEIMENERRIFRTTLDKLDEALIVIADEEFVFINKPAQSILGAGSLKTPVPIEKVREYVRNYPLLDFILTTLKDKDFESEFSYEARDKVYYEIEKITTEEGLIIIKIRNITQKKSLEFQLKNLESISALNNLAAGIAHEIKNPMTAIDLHTQLIKRAIVQETVKVPQEVENYVAIIDEESGRLNRILNDFLVSARKRELSLTFENINEFLDGILQLVEPEFEENGITLVKRYDDLVPKIFIDRDYLKQAVLNLLKNAIEAVKDCSVKRIEIGTYFDTGTGSVAVEIGDSGKGIDDEKIGKIFEPYFTTKEYGTGLGLTIVYKIVKEHGGEIRVESRFTQQSPIVTTFTLLLPTTPGRKFIGKD